MADAKISALTAATSLLPTDELVLARSGTSLKIAGSKLGLFDAYAYLRDEKAANTAGGTFTSAAWQTRDLNTEVFDPDGIVTLSANQFVLAAGTYFIVARAPGYKVDNHQAKLRNITDSTDGGIGTSCFSWSQDAENTDSWMHARVSPAASKTYELQHQCMTTGTTSGFGRETNFGLVCIYAEVWIYREVI